MPDFFNPFSGTVPDRKLTNDELLRAIQLDIAGELEAIHGYMAHADATDNALAKAVLTDIANEERVHAGELIRLLGILTNGEEDQYLAKGKLEVDATAAELATPASEVAVAKDEPTIGSLKTTGA
jgi:rubrerythrin